MPWRKLRRVGLHFCPNCDHFWTEESLWCQVCENMFRKQTLKSQTLECGPLKYLIDWPPHTRLGRTWSLYLRLLKYNRNPRAWEYLAHVFLAAASDHPEPDESTVFIPAPSHVLRDHAYYFAEALARHSGGQFAPSVFRLLDSNPQKEKNSRQRKERAFEQIRAVPAANTLIFVDDVVSTGSTSKAAHQCLGQPSNFQIWALAHRRLSCDAVRALI